MYFVWEAEKYWQPQLTVIHQSGGTVYIQFHWHFGESLFGIYHTNTKKICGSLGRSNEDVPPGPFCFLPLRCFLARCAYSLFSILTTDQKNFSFFGHSRSQLCVGGFLYNTRRRSVWLGWQNLSLLFIW